MQYINLLIIQYYNKPNARAEIANFSSQFESIKSAADALLEEFDIDVATGATLDKIGKIVGIKRSEPVLNDDEVYRFFIKLKIAKNNALGSLTSDTNNGIQDVIKFAFGNDSYIVDKKNMSMDLYVPEGTDVDILRTIFRLNLLPRPQGVRYNNVKISSSEPKFGISNNPFAAPFSSKNDASYTNGAPFDRKIVIN